MSAQPTSSPNTIYCMRCGHHSAADQPQCENCSNPFRLNAPLTLNELPPTVINLIPGSRSIESPEQAAEALYLYAAEMMRQGRTDQEVRNSLMKMGLSRENAAFIVNRLDKVRTLSRRRSTGRRAIMYALIGGVIGIAGVILTIGLYQGAVSMGIIYVIAWGLVILGGLRFATAVAMLMAEE